MTYATQAQLTDRYGERELIALTDRGEVATGAIDTDVIDRALADTDALIDGYLSVRYDLPLAATPVLVTDLALKIAYYNLHISSAAPKVEKDYDDAIATLKQISAGQVQLDIAGSEPDTSGGGSARLTDRERPFTEENMKGYI